MLESKSFAIDIHEEKISDFCRRFQVNRLALFGSVLRSDFNPESDIDVLVTFTPGAQVGMLMLSRMQRELSIILGQSTDLIPQRGLKPLIRDEVIANSQVIYAA
jgi:predicted nucleotidyltransferase